MNATGSHETPMDPRYLEMIMHYIQGLRNDTVDFSKPHLRPSVVRVYPFFVFIYGVLIVLGTFANLAVLWTVARRGLHRDPTYGYIVNLALADIVMCACVLPITLVVLLVQNWVFGRFLCYFLPMLQDIPLHVATLTFFMIAADRYRLTMDPTKPRLPVFFFTVGTWMMAVCIVLPYPIYTTYIDLGKMYSTFHGMGMCVVNLVDNMQEYMRGLFIAMYVLPQAVIAFLYVRVSRELKNHEGPLAVMMYEARCRDDRSRAGSACHDFRRDSHPDSQYSYSRTPGDRSNNYDLYDAELDVNKEKRTQKYLIYMVTIFAICLCPLMVLRLVQLALTETYENTGHFDITFITFVWVAFLPTCTTPALFALWRMSRLAKERLRGYFHVSNRSLRRSCEAAVGRHQQHQMSPARLYNGHSNGAYAAAGASRTNVGNRGGNGAAAATVAEAAGAAGASELSGVIGVPDITRDTPFFPPSLAYS